METSDTDWSLNDTQLTGLGLARELIYTGRSLDAERSLAIGLVNDVVDDAEVLERAVALGGEIAANGREAVRLAKLAMNALARPGHQAAATLESVAQAVLFDSDDKHRRMREFLDRSQQRKR